MYPNKKFKKKIYCTIKNKNTVIIKGKVLQNILKKILRFFMLVYCEMIKIFFYNIDWAKKKFTE